MAVLMQLAYFARRKILGWLRLSTRGVKVMLFNASGELLLIRNSYGNRASFVLPGGGIGRHETPEAAARREIREELGVELNDLKCVATYESNAEGKRDTIHLFRALADGNESRDSIEIEEAKFFSLDALPETVSPATMRRIKEFNGQSAISRRW